LNGYVNWDSLRRVNGEETSLGQRQFFHLQKDSLKRHLQFEIFLIVFGLKAIWSQFPVNASFLVNLGGRFSDICREGKRSLTYGLELVSHYL
jgi:hypothetical protein